MKKSNQLATKLYPARWRARYEAEFDALLDDMNAGWGDLFNIVKGAMVMQIRRSSVPFTATACGLLGVIVAGVIFHTTPRCFASTTMIHIENDQYHDSPDVMTLVAAHVFNDAALESLIERYDLYPSERRIRPMADVLHLFRKDITYRPTPEALQISFTYPDRLKEQNVARDLVAGFMEDAFTLAGQEVNSERIAQQLPPHYSPRFRFNLHVADMPHGVPVGPNLIEMLSLGLGVGALAGVAIGALRRPNQPVAGASE